MSTPSATWVPINDYPGDQQYDDVPGTTDVSYWGTIGTEASGWSWTVNATNDRGDQWVADGGSVADEAEAKAAVESWQPRDADDWLRRRAVTVAESNSRADIEQWLAEAKASGNDDMVKLNTWALAIKETT